MKKQNVLKVFDIAIRELNIEIKKMVNDENKWSGDIIKTKGIITGIKFAKKTIINSK